MYVIHIYIYIYETTSGSYEENENDEKTLGTVKTMKPIRFSCFFPPRTLARKTPEVNRSDPYPYISPSAPGKPIRFSSGRLGTRELWAFRH